MSGFDPGRDKGRIGFVPALYFMHKKIFEHRRIFVKKHIANFRTCVYTLIRSKKKLYAAGKRRLRLLLHQVHFDDRAAWAAE